jgi:hypothetical protein
MLISTRGLKRAGDAPIRKLTMKTATREWTALSNEDGEPWAVFLYGHDHDLRTINSLNCKAEMKKAVEYWCGDSDRCFHGNLNIGRWYIETRLPRATKMLTRIILGCFARRMIPALSLSPGPDSIDP